MIDTSIPAVVLFRGAYGTVAIARTLGRMGVPVYLVAQSGKDGPVWFSRFWTGRRQWDFDRAEDESVQFLRDFGHTLRVEHGKQPVLLTLEDWVAVFLERNGAALGDRFTIPLPERPVLHELLNKWGMHRLAQEHAIPTPTTVRPESLADARRFVELSGFPVLMKAADPYAADRVPTKLIRSLGELADWAGPRAAGGELNMVLQEFIPGGVDSVWMCNGYFAAEAERTITFTGRKLRQVSAAGIASLAVCEQNAVVASQTRRLLEGVGYRGCVGVGWRYDRRDGEYKLLDVNARVSGVFRLFAGSNGVDVVRACYLDMTGQPVPVTSLQPGRKWMLEDDLAAALGAIVRRELTLRGWARSVRGVRELHWLAPDDPLPGLVWSREKLRAARNGALSRITKAG